MKTDPSNIYLFTSNIATAQDVLVLRDVFGKHPQIQCWSVDTEDCDRVLRVVSGEMSCTRIMELVRLCGYECRELADEGETAAGK